MIVLGYRYKTTFTVLALFAQDCGIVRKELDMIIPIVRNEIKNRIGREKLR